MQPENNWRQAVLPINATIGQAVRNLNEAQFKIVLIVNELDILEGTVSDGDIRRGLLKGLGLESPVSSVLRRNPLVVPIELRRDQVMQLMTTNKIYQIPVIDNSRQIIGLHVWDQISSLPTRPNLMVIMAGGTGTRLRPQTESCPKPLLPVAGKPMLEHIIERAKHDGFVNFIISIHYLGHMIEEYFGNGDRLGVKINYLREEVPLGTAGALSLLNPKPDLPFVVTNGDVLTDIRYAELLDFHIQHSAKATMAVRLHEWQHPFGVVKTNGIDIISFEEKPVARTYINAGVYVLEPSSLTSLAINEPCDMPNMFSQLHLSSFRTVAYPMHEPWLDVGRPDDWIKANENHIVSH